METFEQNFIPGLPLKEAGVVMRKDPQNKIDPWATNIPRVISYHSPDGFAWGYWGSGPTDFALNICEAYLLAVGYHGRRDKLLKGAECFGLALWLYQDFKFAFIGKIPEAGGVIPFAELDDWFKTSITPELLERYALPKEGEL